jgi:hypothetical protein
MPTILTLGDFVFQDFEVPESISFGGAQHLAVKKMVGGVRDIQALGPDPKPITWSGMFMPTPDGQKAIDRALILAQMRDAGQPLTLSWDKLYLEVLIRDFDPDYRFYRIPYRISCEVLQDLTAPIYTDPAPNVDDLIGGDLDSANTLTAATGDTGLSGLMSSVSSAVANVKTFVGASLSQVASVLQPIHQAAAYVSSTITQTDTILASVGVPAGVLPSLPVLQNVANFTSIVNATGKQVQFTQIGALLGRMQVNLGQINSSGKTVTVGGGNLFDLASKYYGDATAWTHLAKANGITDPQLTGITTLVVPPLAGSDGGILSA